MEEFQGLLPSPSSPKANASPKVPATTVGFRWIYSTHAPLPSATQQGCPRHLLCLHGR